MAEPFTVTIDRLGAQGDGIAEGPDGTMHVPYALPGEVWRLAEGSAPMLDGPPSTARQASVCRHFGTCGGCLVQHFDPALYRTWKRDIVVQALRHRGLDVPVDDLVTVPLASRRRAVLTAQRTGGRLRLGFHGRRSHERVAIDECPVLEPAIMALLPALEELVVLTVRDADDARITVTLTQTGPDVLVEGKPARATPRQLQRIAEIGTRAALARITVDGSPILERQEPRLTFGGAHVVLPPGAFVQAVHAAEAMISELVVSAAGRSRRIADLFCGLGTLTLPLARIGRVLAIDSARELVDALAHAARRAQGTKPLTTKVRDLFRDPLSPMEMKDLDCVVLDPPRAGAQAQCAQIARTRLPRVVMVSCNPATLARDLRTLADGGFRIDRVTPIDQFVFSPHVEVVAALSRG